MILNEIFNNLFMFVSDVFILFLFRFFYSSLISFKVRLREPFCNSRKGPQ